MRAFISILALLSVVACSKKPSNELISLDMISSADLIILCEQKEENGLNRYWPIELLKGESMDALLNKENRLRSFTHRDNDVPYHDKVIVLFEKNEEEMEGYRRLSIIPVENDSIKALPNDPTSEERINIEILRHSKAVEANAVSAPR